MTASLNVKARPPVVTDVDRQWAMEQCPAWCHLGDGADSELLDEDASARESLGRCTVVVRGLTLPDGSVAFAPAVVGPAGRVRAPNWAFYVDERIGAFERAFSNDRDSAANWSKRWRGFFKATDALQRFPNSRPLPVPKDGYVFLKPGTRLHRVALDFASSAAERSVWARHGAQFEANCATLAAIRAAAKQGAGEWAG